MTHTAFNNSQVQRATSRGTYTVGQDCSMTLKFDTSAAGANSSFTAPTALRVQMVDSQMGQLSITTDQNNTLTGTFIAQ
ncbi:MAG: hypothetical protein ABI759_05100 [Candidatus Solibacter sp.]